MKPRMKFYSNGNRVITGNMIIPYELLTYIMQLNKKDDELFLGNVQSWDDGIIRGDHPKYKYRNVKSALNQIQREYNVEMSKMVEDAAYGVSNFRVDEPYKT